MPTPPPPPATSTVIPPPTPPPEAPAVDEPGAASSAALSAPKEWVEENGKPKAGFSTASSGTRLKVGDGDGTQFELRVGPNYKKNGKKAASATHVYHFETLDVFKGTSITYHAASRLTLPPPPDGAGTANQSGLPRRLVINAIIPADAPPMMGGSSDGNCYQVVVCFTASANALQAWQDAGSPASRLFRRFIDGAPEGVLPSSGDIDIKERMKLTPRIDNMKKLGLGWVSGYNGKPALITKSGSVYRGDDYMEVCMNTFRFAFLTKKGVHSLMGNIPEFELHAAIVSEQTTPTPAGDAQLRRRTLRCGWQLRLTLAVAGHTDPYRHELSRVRVPQTLEGRDDAELPEQAIAAVRITGLDLKLASALP